MPKGERKHLDSLLLGYYHNKKLVYCDHAGTGFNQAMLSMLFKELSALKRAKSALTILPPYTISKHAIWVRPELIAEVEFIAWTQDGYLRHPSFEGLREDKKAAEICKVEAK